MLGRNSSKRLDRRKSTSSAHSKYGSMDADVARHYAHTAAVLAYTRALERNSADMGHRAGGAERSSNVSQDHQLKPQQTDTTPDIGRGVKRQQSVRFAGPNAVQRRQSMSTRATDALLQPKSSTLTLRPIAMTTNALVPAAYRPPSRSSSIGKASFGRATAASFMAGNAFDEYYTREDDIASTPSSYRRVRKSKSMFSPLKAPSVFYTNGSPTKQESICTRNHSSYSNPQSIEANVPQYHLRAPKSMSFLRGNKNRGYPDRNDEAVRVARDRFFHETAQQRLREQPSCLFRSRAQRQEKPFRKSVRSSSGGNGLPSASTEEDQPTKESGLRDAARKASQTIRLKLKRVFGIRKGEPVVIPDQQVDARETHVRDYNGDSHDDFADIPHPDELSWTSVTARNPSLHAFPSIRRLRSFAGSVKSVKTLKSEQDDERSRVTSWTSTGVDTIGSQTSQDLVDRNLQRLSIIDEVGTHVPSSSFRRSTLEAQFAGSRSVTQPRQNVGSFSRLPSQKQVDSARVYSALMKRLDENSPNSKLQTSQKTSMENFTVPDPTPRSSKAVTGSPGSFNSRTPATIRHVIAEDSTEDRSQSSKSHDHQWVRSDSISSAKAENIFGHTGSHVHQWSVADPLREARMRSSDDVFSPKNGSPQRSWVRPTSSSSKKENMPPCDYQLDRTQSSISASALSRQTSTKASYHTVPESFGLTPQEIALLNEPIVQERKRLRDSRSTFFGGTSVTIARATSPYRRAMADVELSSLANTAPLLNTAVPSIKSLCLEPRSAGEEIPRNEPQSEKAYSESVYSRTTSGHPASSGSMISLLFNEHKLPELTTPNSTTGDAFIVDRSFYKPAKPSFDHRRRNDSTSSTEWKKWMSSEVAKLERAKENPTISSYVNYALPTMPRSFHPGHFRESAQIFDDEGSHTGDVHARQPLGNAQLPNPNIQTPPILKPILKKPSALTLVKNSELKASPLSKIPVPVPPPPPIPVRSPLRIMPSRTSLRSQNGMNTPNSANKKEGVSASNVLYKRYTSYGTLRSVKSANTSIKSVETPAKLVKRRRPSYSNTSTPASGPLGGLDGNKDGNVGSSSPMENFPGSSDFQLISNSAQRRFGRTQHGEVERQRRESDIYGINGSGLLEPIMGVSRGGIGRPASDYDMRENLDKRKSITEDDSQVRGSRMMVDLFLSSRRRRIVGASEESSTANGSGPVFL